MEDFIKITLTMAFAALANAIGVIMPLLLLSIAFVIAHGISEFRLIKRIERQNGLSPRKMSSNSFGKTIIELMFVIPIGLLLAHYTQTILFEDLSLRLPNIFSGLVIFWQVWGILENESSCTDKKWAKIAQKILVDKVEQKYNVNIEELKENE